MRVLMLLILLLLTATCFADSGASYYGSGHGAAAAGGSDPCNGTTSFCVDPDVSGGLGDGSSWANAYSALDTAATTEAADITAVAGGYTFYLRSSGGTADTTACNITSNDGWVTDSDSQVKIEQTDFPSTGIYDATKYRLQGGAILVIDVEDFVINGLQVNNNAAAGTIIVVHITGFARTWNGNIDKLILRGVDGSGSDRIGFKITQSDAGSVVVLKNSLVYGFSSTGSEGVKPGDADATLNVYNSTISNNYYGVNNGAGTLNITNSAVFNNVNDWNGTITADYCASDDADATTYTNGIDWTSEATDWAANFTDYANGDFSVKNNSASIYNAGTDLSGSGVTDDIIGTARPQYTTYDIGAFELQ